MDQGFGPAEGCEVPGLNFRRSEVMGWAEGGLRKSFALLFSTAVGNTSSHHPGKREKEKTLNIKITSTGHFTLIH